MLLIKTNNTSNLKPGLNFQMSGLPSLSDETSIFLWYDKQGNWAFSYFTYNVLKNVYICNFGGNKVKESWAIILCRPNIPHSRLPNFRDVTNLQLHVRECGFVYYFHISTLTVHYASYCRLSRKKTCWGYTGRGFKI